MCGKWDAKDIPRDNVIARSFGVWITGLKNPIRGPQLPVTNPNTKNINGKYSIWPNDCLSDVRASRTKTLLNVPPPTSLEQSTKKT